MSAEPSVTPAAPPVPAPERRAQVEQLLGEIFRLAEWPARVELKDGRDGGIAVAVHFQGEVPGVTAGKKSYLVDSLQFLVNKVINRPGVEKRWVTLGVGAFPEPKPSQPPPAASVPAAPRAAAPQRPNPPQQAKKPAAAPAQRAEPVEAEVELTPEWAALGKLLAEKAVRHGRQYAVMSLSAAERAQLVKAGAASGVKVKTEGDGHFRRVAFVPDKPTPMPRKMQFPDDDEEDDDEG